VIHYALLCYIISPLGVAQCLISESMLHYTHTKMTCTILAGSTF